MTDSSNSYKGLKYLILLTVFAIAFSFVAANIQWNKIVPNRERNIAQTVSTNETNDLEYALSNTAASQREVTAMPAGSYTQLEVVERVDDGTTVLGCSSGGESPEGCVTNNDIENPPLCGKGDTSVVVGDGDEVGSNGKGVQVTKNSRIEVWAVTIPMALISGSQYVKDSKLAIEDAEDGFQGTFKNANQIVLDDEARTFCIPGATCDDLVDGGLDGPDGPYAINAHAEMEEQATNHPEPDKLEIKKELSSACPKVQNSKPNPIESNRKAAFIESNFQLPDDKAGARSNGGVPCLKSNIDVEQDSNFYGCLDKRTSYNFLIAATVAIQDWLDCTVGERNKETGEWEPPDPNDCKESVITYIKISPLFGSIYKCNKNECASRYMDLTVVGNLPPEQASARIPPELLEKGFKPALNQPVAEPFYVSTPCKVRVNGIKIEELPCIWDMGVYKRDYERQKAAAVPGNENIPATFEEYWTLVEAQTKGRQPQCN